jgi:aryl-alcohol dehydrogenase-like predicted oxidoreductase
MRRRTFLELSSAGLGLNLKSLAQAPMPMVTLGKSGLRVSKFCLGGYHMAVEGEETALKVIHRALDLGVNFFDSAWLYHKGQSDEIYGKAFTPAARKNVILMSKAERRSFDGAMSQLEDTLRRMRTDYLDLWQCHQVSEMSEVDEILGPKGALEAFVKAKQQGKVRHIGFTGHRDPAVLQRLLEAFDGWETVQHPVNLIDPHYLSFIEGVLPKAGRKGLGRIAMKSNAMGSIGRNNVAPIADCLRFTLSQPIDVLVSGVQNVAQLEQNVGIVKTFKPMSQAEITSLLERTRKGQYGSKIERYKRPPSGAARKPHQDGEPA